MAGRRPLFHKYVTLYFRTLDKSGSGDKGDDIGSAPGTPQGSSGGGGGSSSGPGSVPPSNANDKNKKPHIKKPLNAFMLYMKEMRAKVVAECTLKESAAINQILGRRVSLTFSLILLVLMIQNMDIRITTVTRITDREGMFVLIITCQCRIWMQQIICFFIFKFNYTIFLM